ncbi:hypothetical protein QAD02_020712 [Eretmocerus hayati]|uniref:Uncharacterized protein n=1 Tax=Eretmocerus hayati TaxID=131215 RepID=A0ACC2PQQ4_9HYME|nr:hypothetical protein QAD02_020712 [Eretmocerus hayati]
MGINTVADSSPQSFLAQNVPKRVFVLFVFPSTQRSPVARWGTRWLVAYPGGYGLVGRRTSVVFCSGYVLGGRLLTTRTGTHHHRLLGREATRGRPHRRIEVFEVYSSDDKEPQESPTKKRRVEMEGPFGSSIDDDAPIVLTLAGTAPQPQKLPHGGPQREEPQLLLPMLPHGLSSSPSRPSLHELDEEIDRASNSLSTIALASDQEDHEYDSSSAYSSDEGDSVRDGWNERPAEAAFVTPPRLQGAAAGTGTLRRRTRAERTARNAA